MSAEQNPQTSTDEREEARKEAAIELGKAIALGLVPFVGQAIDAYDTIESSIVLYRAPQGEAKETAQFDFLLALVGWIPGPGDGVKKSLRIVNRDPARFAPVLFDLLRFVLQECGIQTSPETLLDAIFNAGKLRAQIGEIERGVIDSSGFKALPQMMQDVVRGTLKTAQQNMPALVGVVQKRLTKWKRLQHNSSAAEMRRGRSQRPPPRAQDTSIASQGQARGASGHANTGTNGTLATQTLHNITNEITGISGEHIADYICAYTFRWGTDWQGHDAGAEGRWKEGKPSQSKLGKLSKGGSPKSAHVLYRLSDGANGTGIDAVWRAGGNNNGKPYAIVEAKASRNEDAPKFMRRPSNTRKPSMTSSLGVNAIGDPSELLEPLEDAAGASGKTGGGKAGGKRGAGAGSAKPSGMLPRGNESSSGHASTGSKKKILVQMSEEWIRENISRAVANEIADSILLKGAKVYRRHLFYSPAYHPSGSPAAHMKAKLENLPDEQHAQHEAFHYDDSEVKKAVNKRKAALRAKHGNLTNLKAES